MLEKRRLSPATIAAISIAMFSGKADNNFVRFFYKKGERMNENTPKYDSIY